MALVSQKIRVRMNVVAFVVLGFGLSYAMATQVLSVLQSTYSVYAFFPDAGGVFTNQEVTYRGVQVGQVGRLEVVEEGVRIELSIREGVDIPSDDVEARVMFKSAVGEQFVDLLPAGEGEPFLEQGSEIPLEQTSIPVSTQELLSTLEAVLRGVPPEDLKGAVDALGRGLTGTGQDLATIIESSADLAELFARRAPEVQGILRKGTKVGSAFLKSRRDFARAIEELVTVSDSLRISTPALEELLRNSNVASDEIVALIRDNRTNLNDTLIKLAEVNKLQANHAGDLRALFTWLPTALSRIESAFEPRTGLVRFGLVNDTENHACSYKTERRRPEDRGPRKKIPKEARCGGGEGSGAQVAVPTTEQLPDPSAQNSLPGVGDLSGVTPLDTNPETALPARMASWSWTLFYLNVM